MRPVVFLKEERRKKRRVLRRKWYALCAVLLFAVVGLIYAARGSPLFKIRSLILVGGGDATPAIMSAAEKEVLARGATRWLGASNMLAWPRALKLASPALMELSITKDFIHRTLVLSIQRSPRFGIWCVSPQPPECWWFNREGNALERAPMSEGSLILRIEDNAFFVPAAGEPLYDASHYAAVKKILSFLETGAIPAARIALDRMKQELSVETLEGTRLLWSTRFVPPDSLFSFLITQQKAGGLRTAEYVDLTIENRVYVKPR